MLAGLAYVTTVLALTARSTEASSVGTIEHNANHIFNSVHHAMRQWGSSLDHNGMGMFLATVPTATEFYHGTSSQQRINETEWLAFEPEHALVFAQCKQPGRGDRKRPPPEPVSKSTDTGPELHVIHSAKEAVEHVEQPHLSDQQSILNKLRRYITHDSRQGNTSDQPNGKLASSDSPFSQEDEPCDGYLHTYRTNKELRLLYVDGQSAAKSGKGTLDVQDIILRAPAIVISPMRDRPNRTPGGPPNEQERALELCHLSKHEWDGRIDGILRMEAGFEIILCSFEDNLDVVSIQQQKSRRSNSPGSEGNDQLSWYQAIAARFDGIGGRRVNLDYSSFISTYAYANATRFDHDGLPRVVNDTSIIRSIRRDLKEMLVKPASSRGDDIDWQATTDMIVTRYANRIENLSSDTNFPLAALRSGLDDALRPFIDYGNRNMTREIGRCSQQFLSPKAILSNTTTAIAVKETSRKICTALLEASTADTSGNVMSIICRLKKWLSWTTWKKCIGCKPDEVCMIPIWPFGSRHDFEHPTCSNMTDHRRGDYWDEI